LDGDLKAVQMVPAAACEPAPDCTATVSLTLEDLAAARPDSTRGDATDVDGE
jgi:hypothetical protein